ncbi:MAG: hypothetical protein HY866_15390 [Chloroflexi bacterium]|nr:hypothetical protein [Chloroflexota bacterium]
MDQTTRKTLHEVYHLIKAGDRNAARALIKPVLAGHKDNVDAWWLAVHAAAKPSDQRLALVQVLRLNPAHRPARLMLDRLNTENPEGIDELAKELPLPPPGQQKRDLARPHQRRWVWNLMILFGCLSFWFASAAIITAVLGMEWFDNSLNDISEALGGEPQQGRGGQFGTVKGGDPNRPYDIPVTEKESVKPSDEPVLSTLKEDEAHMYTFSAERGQEVMALLQFTIAGNAHFVMELWDAGQKKIATGEGADNSGTVTLVYEFRETGQYALVIIGRPDGPRGGYALGFDLADP